VKKSHGLLAVGLIGASWLAIFGDKTPSSEVAEPVARPSSAKPASPSPRSAPAKNQDKRKRPVTILALEPRAALIGRNDPQSTPGLFAPDVPAQLAASPTTDLPPPAPAVPPLPFTYLGKKYENAKWEVYLAVGDQTYFVREGSVIDQKYAVNAIRPPTMVFTYLPLKQMQTLTIGEAD